MRLPNLAILALLLPGCAPTVATTFSATQTPARAPRAPAEVEVLTSSAPRQPYQELGVLSTESASDLPQAIGLLRAKAAEAGCDGLVVGQAIQKARDIVDGTAHTTEYTATCIVYR